MNRGVDIIKKGHYKQLEVSQKSSKEQLKADKIDKLLETIKKLQPIAIYDLIDVLNMPETTIRMMLVDLERAGAVYSELKISKLNHSKRYFYSADSQEKLNTLQKESGDSHSPLLNNQSAPEITSPPGADN